MERFPRLAGLPPYVLAMVTEWKEEAVRAGKEVVDFGMGNPDGAPPDSVVEVLVRESRNPKNHRYSISKGLPALREAIVDWYHRRVGVRFDPEREAVVTMGIKEGISHLALAVLGPGDVVVAPDPTYAIHTYSAVFAGARVATVSLTQGGEADLFDRFAGVIAERSPRYVIVSFPHNPTTRVVDLEFFRKLVALAQKQGFYVVHDWAYADLVFDGYRAPSIFEVPGAKDVAVEFFTLSKSYNMPGWRVGFCVGNARLVGALVRIKSYLDYGMFQPVQLAAVTALQVPQSFVDGVVARYRERRDALVDGLSGVGWSFPKPRASMFVWAPIPEAFRSLGAVEFSRKLLEASGVVVSPGVGFGPSGEGFVRFALVESPERTRAAVRRVGEALASGLGAAAEPPSPRRARAAR